MGAALIALDVFLPHAMTGTFGAGAGAFSAGLLDWIDFLVSSGAGATTTSSAVLVLLLLPPLGVHADADAFR